MHCHLIDLKLFTIQYQTEIMSPKDKEQFINLVTSKNPHIEIVKEWLHSHSFTLGLSYKVVHE